MYAMNTQFGMEISTMQQSLPTFFDRYRDVILTYTFLRERIINNNSLSTYEEDPVYGHDIDQLYDDMSVEQEKILNDIKINH